MQGGSGAVVAAVAAARDKKNQVRGRGERIPLHAQEVPALEADDFLWDSHALGLR